MAYDSGYDRRNHKTGGDILQGKIWGDRTDPGMLGIGNYRAEKIPINEQAFNDTKRFDQVDSEFAREVGQLRNAKPLDVSQQAQFRGYQSKLANDLMQQARGGGPPSIAQQQLANATNQNIMNAQSQAASMRGMNPAMALRMQQGQAAGMNQQAANQGALLRSQEILNAQNALGNIAQTGRSQDLGVAQAQDQSLLNREQAIMGGLQQRGVLAGQAVQGARDLEKLKVDEMAGMNAQNQAAYADASKRRGKAAEGVAGGLAKIFSFSDRNLKTDIHEARSDPSVQEFLDALSSSTYRYKDPKNGSGRYLGPMAQDLEKTEIGKDMVKDTPEGKMVDYGRGAPAYLGVAGLLNDRMDDLEQRIHGFLDKKGSKK